MKIKHLASFLLTFLFSACGSTGVAEQTPVHLSNALPDLAISNVYLAMQGVTGDCATAYGPYEIRATVENKGSAMAINIPVVELISGYAIQIGELPPGQSMQVFIPASSPNGIYNLSVDPQNSIEELDEGNNVSSYIAPTPTPPVLCTQPATLPPPVAEDAVLSLQVLKNGTYRSPDWGEFQLTDGIFYRTPPNPLESPETYTTYLSDTVFYGDINGDQLEDALVILITQNGGTGHFVELAAVLDQNGTAYNAATIQLGDRVVVESGQVENGVITLNMRVHGPDDGLCCPSQAVTWKFAFDGGNLVQLP